MGRTVEIHDTAPLGKFTGNCGFVFIIIVKGEKFCHQLFRRQDHSGMQFKAGCGAFDGVGRGAGKGRDTADENVESAGKDLIQRLGPAAFGSGKTELAPFGFRQRQDIEAETRRRSTAFESRFKGVGF